MVCKHISVTIEIGGNLAFPTHYTHIKIIVQIYCMFVQYCNNNMSCDKYTNMHQKYAYMSALISTNNKNTDRLF